MRLGAARNGRLVATALVAGWLISGCESESGPSQDPGPASGVSFACLVRQPGSDSLSFCISYQNLDSAQKKSYQSACSGTLADACPSGATAICPGNPAAGFNYATYYYPPGAQCP